MTDPRISDVVGVMHDRASVLGSGSSRRTRFEFGGRTVELITPVHVNASGISLEDAYFPPRAGAEPDFRITVLDDSVAGRPPAFAWPSAWNQPFGAVLRERTDPHRFAFDIHSRSFSTFDPRNGHAVVWFHDVSQIPFWVAATPFRLQLSWMADTFDAEMIHAAGLRIRDSAVLIVGPSGAGKSTLALAAALSDHPLLGDDFLLLSGLRAYPVYRRTKAHDSSLRLLGQGSSRLGAVMNEAVVDQKRIIETDLRLLETSGCDIGAVFVPRIGPATKVEPMHPSQVTRRTLGPSMQGLLGGSPATLPRIARLVNSVPSFEITVGPNVAANVEALEESLDRARMRI